MAPSRPGHSPSTPPNPRTQVVERFTIVTADDLELARFALEDGGEHVVLLDVAAESDQLTSVRDYRDLLTLAEMAGMQVKLLSDDPVRLELARIVGMGVIEAHERGGLQDVERHAASATRARLQAVELAGTAATASATSVAPGMSGTGRFLVGYRDSDPDDEDASLHGGHADRDDDAEMVGAGSAAAAEHDASADLSATAVRRADDPTRRIASTLQQAQDRYRPWQTGKVVTNHRADVALSPDAADPSFAFLSSSAPFPAPARTAAQAQAQEYASDAGQPVSATQHRRAWTSTAPVAAPELSAPAVLRPQNRRPVVTGAATGKRRRSRLRVFAAVGLVLALLLGGGGYAAAVLLPSASVTLTPQRSVVDVTFTYGVATEGATWDLLIQPTPTSRTLSATATLATTGERLEPDQPARGDVLVTNPLTWEVAIPSGTIFVAADGQQFTATEDTSVPAADPYGTLTFGSTTVSVVASVGGSVGNVPPDSVAGQLEAGVYYTNRTAFGGGTDRKVPVVQQADIDALQTQLRTQVEQQIADASAGLVGANQQLLPGSEQTSDITFDIPAQVGGDATEITGSAALTLRAQVYSLAGAHDDAQQSALERLTAAVGDDQTLDAGSVQVGTPQPVDDSGMAFRVTATGEAQARIDQQVLDSVRHDLGGLSVDEARARLLTVPGVAAVDVASRWDWLSGGLPERTSRIDLVVAGDDAVVEAPVTTPNADASPAGTP